MARGAFRADLFHRLNVVNIQLPPLRERPEDIPLLAKSFLEKYCRKYEKNPPVTMSVETVELLAGYSWPGNVRELENLIEQLVVLSDEPRIGPQDLPPYIFEEEAEEAAAAPVGPPAIAPAALPEPGDSHPAAFHLPGGGVKLAQVEKALIQEALERSGGRLVSACKLLGISYKTLQYRVRKYGIDVAEVKEA